MKSYSKSIAALLIVTIFSVALVPAVSFAKNENGDKEKKNEARKEMKMNVAANKEKKESWVQKFMHKIQFGAGKSGKVPPGLLRAPGIQKKLGGMSTSTIAVSPIISDITVSQLTNSSVRITWKTNKPTFDQLFYGTSTPVGTANTVWATPSNGAMTHTVNLSGLLSSITYFYKIKATDYGGRVSSTTELSFMTAGAPVTDTVAPIISSVLATTTAASGAPVHVTWTTNEPATSKVWFGTSTPVISASSTQTIDSATLVTNHDVTLPTLFASSTYYLMVSSADAAGNTSTSAEFTFTVAP